MLFTFPSFRLTPAFFLALLFVAGCRFSEKKPILDDELSIKPFPGNSFYWQYKGSPVLLLGGSKDDNLFQVDSLKEHLELLKSVGGNYVRCSMSSRDEGNVKPYLRDENGLFDLDRPDPAFWTKFEDLLRMGRERNIIVQIEIWDAYDYYYSRNWSQCPFNPVLNKNYTVETSQLPDDVDYPPQFKISPFFQTVPELQNNETVLHYQRQFVDKMLSVSLNYPNILYCIGNENMVGPEWPEYWSDYIREKARAHGRNIYVTEMWDKWDPTGGAVPGAVTQTPGLGGWYAQYSNPALYARTGVSITIENAETYQFVEVANNNAQRGEVHYQTSGYPYHTIGRPVGGTSEKNANRK